MKTYKARNYTIFSLKGMVTDKQGEKKTIKVEFIPATSIKGTAIYVTDNEEEMTLIENSKDFKEGSIYLMKETKQEVSSPKQTIEQEENTNETETTLLLRYKDRADLYNQLCTLLPKENINKKTSESLLLELAKKNGLEFERQ